MRLAAFVSGAAFCFLMPGARPVEAQSQDPHPVTVLVLKDPTPRPPELDKMYGTSDAARGDVAPARQTAYYQQRQALVTRASHQLLTLAETLNRAAGMRVDEKGRAQEVQVASLIEQLAENVHTAMAPSVAGKDSGKPRDGTVPAGDVPGSDAPLTAQTAELVMAARELEGDVVKTKPDTLPVGVLIKSSKVMTLAHAVKQRLGSR